MNNFNFGFIGVGAGGNKLADCFAEEGFNAVAINTAEQDLGALDNITDDNKIFTKINETGGAGKEIRKGEKASNLNNLYSLKGIVFVTNSGPQRVDTFINNINGIKKAGCIFSDLDKLLKRLRRNF